MYTHPIEFPYLSCRENSYEEPIMVSFLIVEAGEARITKGGKKAVQVKRDSKNRRYASRRVETISCELARALCWWRGWQARKRRASGLRNWQMLIECRPGKSYQREVGVPTITACILYLWRCNGINGVTALLRESKTLHDATLWVSIIFLYFISTYFHLYKFIFYHVVCIIYISTLFYYLFTNQRVCKTCVGIRKKDFSIIVNICI